MSKPVVLAGYAILVAVFFLPGSASCTLAFPVAWLALAALRNAPGSIALGLACSALGDYAGSIGSLPLQMAAFALAHMAYLCYLLRRIRAQGGWRFSPRRAAATVWAACMLAAACLCVVPRIPHAGLAAGAAAYALLLIAMTCAAQWQNGPLLSVGAALFLLSDFVLGWNRFVDPLPAASLLIMVPYYAAQLLIFLGAARRR